MEIIYTEEQQPGKRAGCAGIALLIMAWFWVIGVSLGKILVTVGASVFETLVPSWSLPALAAGQALLLIVPLALLARFWPDRRHKSIYSAWAVAGGFVLLLAPMHFTRPFHTQLHAVLHILLPGLFSILVLLAYRRRKVGEEELAPIAPMLGRRQAVYAAIMMAGLFAYPWLAWGALGSITDTMLQVLAAISIGLACAVTIETILVRGLRAAASPAQPYPSGWQELILAGFGAGATLLIMASGTGFGYGLMQLVLMSSLPPLGWAMAWLSRARSRDGSRLPGTTLAMALLIGLAAAAPLTLIDPKELNPLIIGAPGEIWQWAFNASLVSLLFGFVLGFALLATYLLERKRATIDAPRLTFRFPAITAAITGMAWFIGGVIYVTFGQPGFFGDSLFVILKDQVEAPVYVPGEDYFEHRAVVYSMLVEHANESQAGLQAALDRYNIDYTPYYLINSLEVRGGPLVKFWLSTRPEVDRVLNNPWMRPLPSLPPMSSGEQPAPEGVLWNLELISAHQVWEQLDVTGEGMVIGHSDSGVQWDHPELVRSYRGREPESGGHNFHWFDPWYNTQAPEDLNGHGTHTLGTILGQNTGVAPGATWFACANLTRSLGNPALYLDCMQFMLAPFPLFGNPFLEGDPSLGAHVTNNSWGCPEVEGCDAGALHQAVQALRAAGVFVVSAAGNDGPACGSIHSPIALYAEAFSVGAIDRAGRLLEFSSRGPVTVDGSGRVKPDLVAPGWEVLSAYPNNTYHSIGGTSMAAPHVAGVVALVWSANPGLVGDIDRTEQILAQSASPYTGSIPGCPGAEEIPSTAFGYGILDAYRAVQMALAQSMR